MCGWLFASMSGLTRTATRAARPERVAIASTRASSPADSTLMALRPSATAHSSSAGDLPTPVNTISAAETRPSRDLDLPDRVGVGARCRARAAARDERQRRVRLERVVNRVRVAAERLVELAVALRAAAPRCRRTRACPGLRRSPRASTPSQTSSCGVREKPIRPVGLSRLIRYPTLIRHVCRPAARHRPTLRRLDRDADPALPARAISSPGRRSSASTGARCSTSRTSSSAGTTRPKI